MSVLNSVTTSVILDNIAEGLEYQLSSAGVFDGASITFEVWSATLDDWAPLGVLTESINTLKVRATGKKFRATISGGGGDESVTVEALRLPVGSGNGSALSVVHLTEAHYFALPLADQQAPSIIYVITEPA